MLCERQLLIDILNNNVPDFTGKKYIWGTGNTAFLYQQGLKRLNASKELLISGYTDSNPKIWGGNCSGYPVYSPEELASQDDAVVLICTIKPENIRQIREKCAAYNLKSYLIDEVILKLHWHEVIQVYDFLNDNRSKEIYFHMVMCRLFGENPNPEMVETTPYFSVPEVMANEGSGCFVDCGGFNGDTVEQYIWKKDGVFDSILAIEPDAYNIRAMNSRFDRLKREWNLTDEKLSVLHAAIGEHSDDIYVESYSTNNGLGSKVVEAPAKDTERVHITSIDDLFKDRKVSFIKADIESYEYNMLLGADEVINRDHPVMAICIYHNAVDFYSIPLLIRQIDSGYQFKIRQHSYTQSETVLYCW